MISVPRLTTCCTMLLFALAVHNVASAQREGRTRVIYTSLSEMVEIPAGSFEQGFPEDEAAIKRLESLCEADFGPFADGICTNHEFWADVKPNRQIHLKRYSIDRYEVSAGNYRDCVRAGRCDIGALLFGDQRYNNRDWPIGNVTWAEADTYCKWRGKRLPTDAEWEKAARGPGGNLFPWGQFWGSGGSNHGKLQNAEILQVEQRAAGARNLGQHYVPDSSDGYAYPAVAGEMIWGDSPYGVANMAGNVQEWVFDYYSFQGYGDLPTSNPTRSVPRNESMRSTRGGSWMSPRALGVTFYRRGHAPTTRMPTLGFRCAR